MKINEFVPDTSIFDKFNVNNNILKGTVNDDEDTKSSGIPFSDLLKEKLDSVNDKILNADSISESYVKGEGPDISEVMLSGEEAKMSLELAVQVRNKLVEAYQEISRTQL